MGGRNPVIVAVTADNLELWKPRLEWHFKSFCRSGDYTPDELWDEIQSGDRRLWVVWSDEVLGCFLSIQTAGPESKIVLTHAAGRDRNLWLPLWPVIEAHARAQGCSAVVAHCRPGWMSDLKRVGMRRTHVIMEKRL